MRIMFRAVGQTIVALPKVNQDPHEGADFCRFVIDKKEGDRISFRTVRATNIACTVYNRAISGGT